MSYSTEREEILSFFRDSLIDYPIYWENSPGGEPERPFIQPRIISAGIGDATLGNGVVGYAGILDLTVVDSVGVGTKRANKIVDKLITLFTDTPIGTNIRTRNAYKTVIGPDDGRYSVSVTVPFERDEYN